MSAEKRIAEARRWLSQARADLAAAASSISALTTQTVFQTTGQPHAQQPHARRGLHRRRKTRLAVAPPTALRSAAVIVPVVTLLTAARA